MTIDELERASGGTVRQTKYLKKNPLRRYFIRQYLQTVAELAVLTGARRALDVGCGEGFVIRHLRNVRPETALIGIDLERDVLRVAAYQNPDTIFAVASATALPLTDASFDLALCNEVLEHLPSPLQALDEIARVSARYFVFSVPREPHYRLANMMAGSNWSRWGDDSDHLQRWTRDEFVAMLERRFEIVAVRTPFPWTMVCCQKPRGVNP